MLRINLQPQALYARSRFSVSMFVVGREIAALGYPSARVGAARLTHYRENPQQGNAARVLRSAFGCVGIPDVSDDSVVVERYQELCGLIVRGTVPEIAARRELRDLPVPGEVRHLRRLNIDSPLQCKGRVHTLEVEAWTAVVRANTKFRPSVIHLHLPVHRRTSGIPRGGIQNDEGKG